MRILPGACVPVALKSNLASLGHECQTVREAGFAGKKNSELLTLAEGRWELLLTPDRKIEYQQIHDWAKDWDAGSAREDQPPTGISCLFCQSARKRFSQSERVR
jgi:hypothetical protein